MYGFISRKYLDAVSLQCLTVDHKGNIWLGTSSGLQHILFDSAKHVVLPSLRYESLRMDIGPVYDIEEDPAGDLWLATNDGLLYFNPQKGNFYKYTPYDKDLLNTEHKRVHTIVPESPGIFLIGTSEGAYRFYIQTHEFSALGEDTELLKSNVTAIAVDNARNLWLGTTGGLFYYEKQLNSLFFYDQKEGLVNNTYTSASAGTNGDIYFGGPHGLSVIHSGEMKAKINSFRVLITRLHFLEKEPSKIHNYFQIDDTIQLPWQRKPLQIDFALQNLVRPEYNRYKYSLGRSGKTGKWYQLGTQNYVVLDRLSPGKYTLQVSGSSNNTAWSNPVTSLVIVIDAPAWRSRTAMIVYIALGVLLIFMLFRFWTRQFFNLSRENQQREMFARQIMLQKEELTLKNKSITDSINYAKRIQTAMLPPYRLFKSIFQSSFVLYMPKDIVSGDFYWINKLNDKIFVAAVDCTGHGVPGAFMSIIGFELFRKITNIEGLSRPSDILNRLNEDFHVIFKDVDNVVLRDGMDVAFCSIDKKDMILEFAGAFNPLYLIRDNKITEIKGDRFAIGLDETDFKEQTFKNHLIPIQKGDIIYIFSDGFADQFGGPDGKKYKYRRFRHLLLTLHQLPMEKQHEILENNVMEWRGTQEQVDDILVIGIKIDF
jgi:serine phosphatase RsbU (regulator of sigma subunit)